MIGTAILLMLIGFVMFAVSLFTKDQAESDREVIISMFLILNGLVVICYTRLSEILEILQQTGT